MCGSGSRASACSLCRLCWFRASHWHDNFLCRSRAFPAPWMCWRLCRECVGPCCVALLLSLPVPSDLGYSPGNWLLPGLCACAPHRGFVLSIFPLPFSGEMLSQLLWAGARVISIRSTREKPQAHRTDNFVKTDPMGGIIFSWQFRSPCPEQNSSYFS